MILKENIKQAASNSMAIANICESLLAADQEIDRDKEHFWVFGLDSQNYIQYIDLVTLGTLTSTTIHPREVFRLAIWKGVHAIIVAHNHNSCNAQPSGADIATTKNLKAAGEILGIPVVDHVIVAQEDNFYSFHAAWKL